MRDMIVLLPGIIGSVLEKDGKDLWAPSCGAIFSALISRGKSLQQLKLGADDITVDDLGDGIRATRLIADTRIVPGFIKVDGYNRISEMINGNFEVEQGTIDIQKRTYPPANYFAFPYDWRRDNRVSAKRLADFIRQRLAEWREYAGAQAQVIIVAHSMGGIVARYYLEALQGWTDCKALITFGTPFRGSVKALNYLANGCDLGPFEFTDLVRSFTSVYQLLPIYKVVRVDGGLQKVTDVEIPRFNRDAARSALAFHQRIIDLIELRKKRDGHSAYVLAPVVGQYQPTLQSAELFQDSLTVSEEVPSEFDELLGHGDGTVPRLSAVPPEESKTHRNIFFAESHGMLHCNDQALDFLYDQLTDLQVQGLEDLRGPERFPGFRSRTAISLRVPDFCLEREPLVIGAQIIADGRPAERLDHEEIVGSLTARLTPTDGNGAASELAFQRDGDDWVAIAPNLSPAIYRLTAQASRNGPLSPSPVHEIFQVAGG